VTEIFLQEYCEQIENAIEQGRYAEAVAHGKHILELYPKHATTYRLLGKAMIEAGQDEYATDMFRRVLSADPEDWLAWAGMSEAHSERGELDAALWCLERAFELATDNKVLEKELRHLYGRRDGVEPQRVQLTRGALARLYLRGDLLSRAISELRTMLAEHPERVDLTVAMAEALWRNEQRLEASEVCQQVLDELPYCLKANLLLGEIWTSSGREEGQAYLQRAEALDPENQMAQKLFGAASPLLERQVRIVPLEYKPPSEEERPAWMAKIEGIPGEKPPPSEREAALVDITAALEAQIEIPPWLEEIVGEEAAVSALPGLAEPSEEQALEEAIPAPAEEVPEWLAGIEGLVEEEAEAVAEEEAPEWPELGLEPAGEEEAPEQLAELGIESTGEEEAPAAPGEAEVPEWPAELGVEAAGEEAVAPAPPAEQLPDWLTGLREQFAEEGQAPEEAPAPAHLPAWLEGEGLPSGEEALDWLEQLAAGKEEELHAQAEAEAEARMAEIMGRPRPTEPFPEEAVPEEAAVLPVEEAAAPPAEEAFGWTAFGEPEAPPVAEVPAVEEALPVEEAAPEEAAPEEALALPVEEAAAPPAEEAFGWTAFGEPEAPPVAEVPAVEEALPVEEAAPEEAVPEEAAVLPVEKAVAPPAEEAFGWTAFGEPEAPPVAEVPAVEEALPVEEAAPEEAAPEEALALPVEEAVAPPGEEAFGWTAFGEPEAPPVAEFPAVEEALPIEEAIPLAVPEEIETPPVAEVPVMMEEGSPPEEAPAPEIPLEEEVAPAPVVEEVPGVPEMEMPELLEEAAAEAPAEPLAAERAYLKEHPRDYKARLTLAQALWQAGERQEALEAYTRVIRSGKLLEEVIPDLEICLEQWPDLSTQQTLGDAYMKADRLQEALDIYRRALESL